MTQDETPVWRDLYRVLFDKNIAGVVLSRPDGHIVDCNEPCARIFGFDSKKEMLRHSAWDFYFERSERETLLRRLRTEDLGHAEEACLRTRTGDPVWVLATRAVVSFEMDRPELLQGTVIDITDQRRAQARLRDIEHLSSFSPVGESIATPDISQRLVTLVESVSNTLQPNNLPRIDRAEMRECLLALEQLKMLIGELEVRRFLEE
jgi:PAS domain S-box-containing protein